MFTSMSQVHAAARIKQCLDKPLTGLLKRLHFCCSKNTEMKRAAHPKVEERSAQLRDYQQCRVCDCTEELGLQRNN